MSENSIGVVEIINYKNEVDIDFDDFTESINDAISVHNSAQAAHPFIVQSVSETLTKATDAKLELKVDISDAAVTKQGNTFNGAEQLVKLNSSGKLPVLDGSLLTNIKDTSLFVNCELPLKNTSGLVSLKFDETLKLANDKLSVVLDNLIKSDGSLAFSAEQHGVAPTSDSGLTTKSYVDNSVKGMIKSDGSVDFTVEQKGTIPTSSNGLTTKSYVDNVTNELATKTLSNITTQAASNLNSAGIRTVVSAYSNGTSWYRIYSDGWIEQGGQYNLSGTSQFATFLIPFVYSNYFLSSNNVSVYGAENNNTYNNTYSLSTTGFWSRSYAGCTARWYVCGY